MVTKNQAISQDIDWPQPLKYLDLTNRGVTIEYLANESAIRVTAAKPTKGFVFEERPGLWLSDNGFGIVPNEERIIGVRGLQNQDGIPAWTFLEDDRQ